MNFFRKEHIFLYATVGMFLAFISAVPALGLLAATAAAGYITVKLMPLVAGQDNLRLSLTTFLMSFIPILTCNYNHSAHCRLYMPALS